MDFYSVVLCILVAVSNGQTLTWKDGTSVNLAVGHQEKASREALVVFVGADKVYKIFTSKNPADTQATAASSVDVTTPEVKVKEGTLANYGGKTTQTVYVAVQKKVPGNFFQLSKSGHIGVLTKAINAASSEVTKTRAKRALEAATKAKITDPQGFFDDSETNSTPIMFIDIHTGAHAAGSIEEVSGGIVLASGGGGKAELSLAATRGNSELILGAAGAGLMIVLISHFCMARKQTDYSPLLDDEEA